MSRPLLIASLPDKRGTTEAVEREPDPYLEASFLGRAYGGYTHLDPAHEVSETSSQRAEPVLVCNNAFLIEGEMCHVQHAQTHARSCA